ncbi:MAG: APC family permease [Thermoflexales bacterium]|nr:APC family permease [Thermoflexales bacterium]
METSLHTLRNAIFGKPLASHEAAHQTISKTVGLAVFASDALSSVAYAPGEILLVLLIGGLVATQLALPIAIAIVIMLLILTISYRQTIFAYPGGGGAYIVARDNISEAVAQVAGAALLTDYILTVAVSITSGWENVSATFPALQPHQTVLSVLTIIFMTVMNLRGVKESGRVFAVPTYFFIVMVAITMVVAAVRYLGGTLPVLAPDPEVVEALKHSAQNLTLLLVLRAFSSGCTALTGVEAISNGITAFKEPKSRNAATTMLVMSTLIAINFIGIVFFAGRMNVLPQFEIDAAGHLHGNSAVLPYMTQALFGGDSIMHWMLVVSTMLILMMAANTSYADFPRLCALQAGDGFLPRQLTFRGGRLVFSWGIVTLAVASIILVILFGGSTSALIPLYAIGVFLSFSISQAGMVLRWHRISKLKPGEVKEVGHSTLHYDKQWAVKMVINAIGAVMAFVVMIIFAVTKFEQGAWITVILIPSLVFVFFRIHRHYKDVAHALSLSVRPLRPHRHDMLTVVMVDDVHIGTVHMVDYALSEGNPWIAVHLDDNPAKTERTIAKWKERLGDSGHELVIVPCPYRNLSETAIAFIQSQLDTSADRYVNVVLGQLVMDTWQAQALHANTNLAFYLGLQRMERVAITNVSYQIHAPEAQAQAIDTAAKAEAAEVLDQSSEAGSTAPPAA